MDSLFLRLNQWFCRLRIYGRKSHLKHEVLKSERALIRTLSFFLFHHSDQAEFSISAGLLVERFIVERTAKGSVGSLASVTPWHHRVRRDICHHNQRNRIIDIYYTDFGFFICLFRSHLYCLSQQGNKIP